MNDKCKITEKEHDKMCEICKEILGFPTDNMPLPCNADAFLFCPAKAIDDFLKLE